ncbi:hypothetical protein AB4Y90_14085 [Chryseobacterium sp. 2TAF14]|uniref:hypothetical protein n=1 Tax=Chryseobacterium sp. 2TAF14 TaxID=3233007 RepID=UPI003F93CD37
MEYNTITLQTLNVNPFNLTSGTQNHHGNNYFLLNIINPPPTALIQNHAVYIQHLATCKKFNLLTGIRQEWFKDITNYKKTEKNSFQNQKLLYRVGFTYRVAENTNSYGTHLTGCQPPYKITSLIPQAWWTEHLRLFPGMLRNYQFTTTYKF